MKICPACSREYPPERSHCERDGVLLVALTAGTSQEPQDLVGRIVDGRYQVEGIVGKGGMGTVYACRHVVVGKPFAMKVSRQGVEQTEGVLQRFIREAQTANSVRSRHIVEMTDFGQLPSGQFYVTMELLLGMDLGKALKRGLSRPELLHVFIQCADVLALTHNQGIVHRDLKPDNIFLVNEEGDPLFVKLLDFGIAKAMHSGPSGLTETGVVLGTPYYMSPEQARGEEVDHRTDVYSLGVIMYRAFTGKLPFVADSAVGVLTRHLTEAPAPPSRIAGTDAEVERIILCCLEKRREARFQSMQQLSEALRVLAGPAYQGTRSGAVAAVQVTSGAYTSAPVSVHQGRTASGAYPAGPSGAYPAGPSGAYPAGPSGAYPAGPSGAYPAGPSGQHPVMGASGATHAQGMSGRHPAGATGGHSGGAVSNASGGYNAAVSNASGGYSAAVPNASGGYNAAVPNASGGYSAAVPNASGGYSAANTPAPQPSGAFGAANAPSSVAYTTGPTSVYNPPRPYGDPVSPELTSRGLAASQGMKPVQQTRKWPLLVGAIFMLGLGGIIAVSLGALRGSSDSNTTAAAATATAAPSLQPTVAQSAATTTAAADPTQPTSASSEPQAAGSTAPSSAPQPSAAPTTAAAQASGTPVQTGAPVTKPTGKVPSAATAKTAAPTTKRPPEIRSPFD